MCTGFTREKAKEMAQEGRAGLTSTKVSESALLYNEIEFLPFVRVLEQLKIRKGAKFVDLGSGLGKAVFAASLLFDFAELHGYELLAPLVEGSRAILSTCRMLQAAMHELPTDHPKITFHQASIVDADWAFADVVFANASCFNDELISTLAVKASALKVGAFVVTVTHPLVTPALKVVSSGRYRMSDNTVTIYVQQRVKRTPVGGAASDRSMSPSTAATAQQAAKTLEELSSPQGGSLLAAKGRRARKQAAHSKARGGVPRPAWGEDAPDGSRGVEDVDVDPALTGFAPDAVAERVAVAPGASASDADLAPEQLRLFKPRVAAEVAKDAPSSPQADLLLARKMANQSRRRTASIDRPSSAAGRMMTTASSPGLPIRRMPHASRAVRDEMDGGEAPSSPQGDLLLARKAQFGRGRPRQQRFYT